MKKFTVKSTLENIVYSFHSIWYIDKGVVFIYGFNVLLEKIQPFFLIFFPKFLIDELVATDSNWYKVLAIISGFIVAMALTSFFQRYTYGQTSVRLIKYRLLKQKELALKTINIEYKSLETPLFLNDYNLAQQACSNYNTGMEGVLRTVFSFILNVFSVFAYITILITLNVWIVIALIMVTILVYFTKGHIVKFDIDKRNKLVACKRRSSYFSSVMFDFSYGKDIRIFNLKEFFLNKYTLYNNKEIEILKGLAHIKTKWYQLINIIDLIKEFSCLGYLLYKVFIGAVGIGSFTMYFATLNNFSGWINDLTDSLTELSVLNIQVNDFKQFMQIPYVELKGQEIIDHIDSIEFKNVWFRYPGTERYILKNINIYLKKGTKLAIVGKNGEGKTTFIKLLCGFYHPNKGAILINGKSIDKIKLNDYKKLLAVVFQTINIFAFSIASNVALTNKDEINMMKVKSSLAITNLDYILKKNHNGIETSLLKILDEEGIELSGGEIQKIGLARAIYKEGDVLILDEPTSHLDALSENRIYKQYLDITKDKIAVFISHRLASTRFCDQIIMLEDGEILETGTHDELLALNGRYADIFKVQSVYYNEGRQVEYEK